jgi:sterol 24-C-methyltransferase
VSRTTIGRLLAGALPRRRVRDTVDGYRRLHDESRGGNADARRHHSAAMTSGYYDLVTDFYEYGWGPSFHFAPCHRGESFQASLARYEMYVAHWLALRPGMRVLDVGCGVGGPMRTIARFSGAHITGLNNNGYQLKRAQMHNADHRLTRQCDLVRGDFTRLPFADASFDAVYQIEATAHAPDRRVVYAEILRVLEPGGRFCGYEWCITDRYDPASAEHRAIKKGIEEGTSLPDLCSIGEVLDALDDVGFERIESHDHALTADADSPWWRALAGGPWWTVGGFRASPVGRLATHGLVRALETVRVLPAGATEVSTLLNVGADALIRGGRTGIFTPMYFYCGRKPPEERQG